MSELFFNPANMVVGALLIASPILIHLINRVRFKRVRWAAMEFLLRSQKKNQRRLLIEQLLLLASRIALVLLTGLLLARFLGLSWAGFQPANTLHVVILDDRLSMGDHWQTAEGRQTTSFRDAKQLLERELAKVVAAARTPQRLVFFRLSQPADRFDVRLNEDALKRFAAHLATLDQASYLHLDLLRGVEAAQAIFDQSPQDNRFLHLVSDFRQRQWGEAGGEALARKLESLARAGIKIHLVDAAHPYRGERQKLPLYHDNLAIVELRPESRVAAQDRPVQFTVTVANFSPSERKNVRVTVKVNGAERLEASVPLASVPPGHTSGTFQVAFNQLGINEITANLEDEEAGLEADNIRFAAIEVRRQVPVLLIDGDPTNGTRPGGDSFHLRTLLQAAGGFEVAAGSPADLERPTLTQFACVYLLNLRELNDQALKNLEDYVRGGGGIAYFLGDRINPDYYTKTLYAGGKGIFPVPLADRPSPALTDEERQEHLLQNLTDPRPQLLIRDPEHPIFKEVADPKLRGLFDFLTIERHYPVPRSKWEREPGRVEELATLPNDCPVSDYQQATQQLLDALPISDARYEKYRAGLDRRRRTLQEALSGKTLAGLGAALGDLLQDPPEPGGGERPRLTEFWQQPDPKVQSLRVRLERLREQVVYGDPLVVTGHYGKGRTVVFLTTAGKAWNDWAGGGPASVTYPVVMLDLQKFLTGVEAEDNRTAGSALEIEVDGARYDARAHGYLQQVAREAETGKAAAEAPPREGLLRDLGEITGTLAGNRLTFLFDRTREPGVYQFDLTQRGEGDSAAKTERRAFVVNVDTANESDLRRAARDDLERVGTLSTPVSGSFADLISRPNDLSESAWVYLVFLVLLVVEQALAVHLSFHLQDQGSPLPGIVRRRQPAAA